MEIDLSQPSSRPSTSHQTAGLKRRAPHATAYEDTQLMDAADMLPLSDYNSWYYPSHGHDSDEDEIHANIQGGNWGRKSAKNARWVRKGKMVDWGPGMEDWAAEERSRKRLKALLPRSRRSLSPPVLPHLRSPSPPMTSPYPPPITQHLSYASFVMDKAVTHSFRSSLLDELEHATNGLIEGEATMRRAMGRLWQVISEDPDTKPSDPSLVPKLEDEDHDAPEEYDEREKRLARAPDLTPAVQKLFLLSYPANNGVATSVFEPSHFASPEMQLETLEKSLATLRELQADGQEYVERLEEIREGLGDARAQRDGVWNLVRERAIKELQDVAFNMAV